MRLLRSNYRHCWFSIKGIEDMAEAIVRDIEYTGRNGTVTIVGLFDIHYGARACAEDALAETVERIRTTPDCLWFGGGDMGEFIIPGDKRYQAQGVARIHKPEVQAEPTTSMIDGIVKALWPIRTQCLGIMRGNHERTIARTGGVAPARRIAEWLGTVYLGEQAWIALNFKRANSTSTQRFVLWAQHGVSTRTKNAETAMAALARTREHFDYDLGWAGHVHFLDAKVKTPLELSNERPPKLRQRPVFLAIGGCFRKDHPIGYDDYADQMTPREPSMLGCAAAIITPDKRRIKAEQWTFWG